MTTTGKPLEPLPVAVVGIGPGAQMTPRATKVRAPKASPISLGSESEGMDTARPAHAHLTQPVVRQPWERRAAWLEAEAQGRTDPVVRARLMLAASEIRAMLGTTREARTLAADAHAQAPDSSLALRQSRTLAQQHGDLFCTLELLTTEASQAKSPALKAQAHFLASEVCRLLQRDPRRSEQHLEEAKASDPDDLRPALQHLATQLARSFDPPDNPFSTDESLAALHEATAQLRQLRGEQTPSVKPAQLWALTLVETSRALCERRLNAAAQSLDALKNVVGLEQCVRWLQALWISAGSDAAATKVRAIRQLAEQSPGRLACRTLAARALAANDGDGVRRAIASASKLGATTPAFSDVERLSLLALVGDTPDPSLSAVDRRPAEALALRPLTVALARLSNERLPSSDQATSLSEAEFELGRRVAQAKQLEQVSMDSCGLPSDSLWRRVVELQRSRQTGDVAGLAASLSLLVPERSSLATETHYLSGVLLELAGKSEAAEQHYRQSMTSAATREPSVRALASNSSQGARLFRSLSAHAETPLERAQWLTEALYRLPPEAAEFDAIAEEAAQSGPELPFAALAAETAARMRGDRSRVIRWLTRQQDRAEVGDERAIATLRHALFVADDDPRAASTLLSDIWQSAEGDLTLQALRESLDELPTRARAHVRRQAAANASSRLRSALLHEAVLLYEDVGDLQAAASTAESLQGPLGTVLLQRVAWEPAHLRQHALHWQGLVDSAESVADKCDALERLAQLELRQGNREAALAHYQALIALDPASLTTLRHVEREALGRTDGALLQQVASKLLNKLPERDGLAYAFVAARLAIESGDATDLDTVAQLAARVTPSPLWALRLRAARARQSGNDPILVDIYRELSDRANQPLDVATLSLRAAESAARLGDPVLARREIDRAVDLAPDNVVVLSTRAEILCASGDHADAAEALEALAGTATSPSRQVDALFRAATIWLDVLGDRGRGVLALQEAAAINVPHAGVVQRLRQIHTEADDYEGLRVLAEQQLPRATDPAEAISLDVTRALSLDRTGKVLEAQQVLEAVLAKYPNNVQALNALGEISQHAERWSEAKGHFEAAVSTSCRPAAADRDAYLAALKGLASLFEGPLSDPKQARLTHEAIVALDPDNDASRRRLVRIMAGANDPSAALPHQRALVEHATNDEERRQYMLELIDLLATTGEERSEAEVVLEQARRTWPENAQILKAEVGYYRRAGNVGTAQVIVERATHAARNAIRAGRLEPGLFRTLEMACRLGGDPATARSAQVALAAICGHDSRLPGAGLAAGQRSFDDLIAPSPLGSGFRKLLYAAGAAIDQAYSIDEEVLAPTPLSTAQAEQVKSVAISFGLNDVRVMVSAALGCDCLTLPGRTMTVVFGQDLLDHPNPRARDFLLLRALKIAQLNACALSRMTPTDLWAAVAGFLACFSDAHNVEGDDAQRLLAARNEIRPHLTQELDPELIALAPAISANLVPQAAQVGDALWRWASRVALFGVGELGVALESLWAASDMGSSLSKQLDARVRWIASNSQARDLVSYGVSEAYTEARKRAGLTQR